MRYPPLHKIVIFLAILFTVVMIYELNEDRKEEFDWAQKEIGYRDSIIRDQEERIQELEEQQDVMLSTLQLREEEIEFWINISDLYKKNRKKEAQKLIGISWN